MDDQTLAAELERRGLVPPGAGLRILEFEERLIRRDRAGKFANKPGSGGAVAAGLKGRGGGKRAPVKATAGPAAKPGHRPPQAQRNPGRVEQRTGPTRTKQDVAKPSPSKSTGESPFESPEQEEKARRGLDKIAARIPLKTITGLKASLARWNVHHTAEGMDADEVAETFHRLELVAHELIANHAMITDIASSTLQLLHAEDQDEADRVLALIETRLAGADAA